MDKPEICPVCKGKQFLNDELVLMVGVDGGQTTFNCELPVEMCLVCRMIHVFIQFDMSHDTDGPFDSNKELFKMSLGDMISSHPDINDDSLDYYLRVNGDYIIDKSFIIEEGSHV